MVLGRLRFYSNWLADLSSEDLDTVTGRWVIDRVILLGEAVISIEKTMGSSTTSVGNYTNRIVEGL